MKFHPVLIALAFILLLSIPIVVYDLWLAPKWRKDKAQKRKVREEEAKEQRAKEQRAHKQQARKQKKAKEALLTPDERFRKKIRDLDDLSFRK